MHDPLPIPSCFFSGDRTSDEGGSPAVSRAGQSAVVSVYRTKIAGHCRLITVTWCKNLLVHGLSISVEGTGGEGGGGGEGDAHQQHHGCRVELRPWHFWRKQGSRRLDVAGEAVDVLWDLRAARFCGEPEPRSGYYVAVVSGDEVVLLLGDMGKEAYRKSGSPPSPIDAILVSKKEHVFGKKKFSTKAKFHEKGKLHDISIEFYSNSGGAGGADPEMVVKIDGQPTIHVRHLQWKFRGNEAISVDKVRVEVYWDAHDWLFGPGMKHALFIFKPIHLVASPATASASSPATTVAGGSTSDGGGGGGSSDFSLFLYAWKLE
ncbi:hypothetical protein Taro_022662 [Colocasia esculenta]|uniref:Uncharacterized protein n=1 Tax=Colocasia esculenta TaxID=4460 RepID=A0A843UV26_COLES|nr:hypothetical protein [Colocasia esculenta]